MKFINRIVGTIFKRCMECGTRLDLRRYTSCTNGWICTRCANAHGYTNYQPSLRT